MHSRRTGWIKEVFGPKGFQEALKVVTRKGVKTTEFKDHINLEPYIVGEREAYDPQAFAEVIHQFTKEEPKPTKADFEIRIITPDDIFSSLDRKGQLNEGDSLILEIHCLKTKHLFVCWLTCKGKTPVELYPVFSIDSENPNSGHLFNKQQKIITIPEQGCSEVDEGPGVETCLVAMRETPYKIDDRTKIINTVTKALKIRKVSFPPLKMTMSCLEPHRITEHAMSGLRTPSIGDKWEKQLAIELRELADKIYFLKVPNRG